MRNSRVDFLNKKVWLGFILVLLLSLLTACGSGGTKEAGGNATSNESASTSSETTEGENESKETNQGEGILGIGSQPVGGNFYAVSTAWSKFISDHTDYRVSSRPYQGLSAYGPQIDSGKLEFGIASIPELTWGHRGENGFEEMKNLRLIFKLHDMDNVSIMVRKDSGIEKISDLKGKRVAAGYAGSLGAIAMLEAGLELNGISLNDVKQVPVASNPDALAALQDNNVDAIFGMTPLVPDIQDVHNSVELLGLSALDNYSATENNEAPAEANEKLMEFLPAELVVMDPDPAGVLPAPIWAMRYQTGVVASDKLSDEVVYDMLEAMWENTEELKPTHPWFGKFAPENMLTENLTIPYHEGAVKFFKDKGIWTDEIEEKQQSLLK